MPDGSDSVRSGPTSSGLTVSSRSCASYSVIDRPLTTNGLPAPLDTASIGPAVVCPPVTEM